MDSKQKLQLSNMIKTDYVPKNGKKMVCPKKYAYKGFKNHSYYDY